MAVLERVSVRTNQQATLLRGRTERPSAQGSLVEPDVPNKWHPRKTLAFIVLSSGLLWGGILALAGVL
jgi:hypothetical protein